MLWLELLKLTEEEGNQHVRAKLTFRAFASRGFSTGMISFILFVDFLVISVK